MRILFASTLAVAAAFASACTPSAEEPASAPVQTQIESTSAPAMGGPTELPKDGGVTPAPDAVAGATAEQVAAPASPAEAAVLSGGSQAAEKQ